MELRAISQCVIILHGATDRGFRLCEDAFFVVGGAMKLTEKIRRDWHYYAFALGLIFILNGVVGLLGFETQGWQSYAVGLVTWVISFWIAGKIIRRRQTGVEEA